MILGQSAAIAAALAIDERVEAIQDISYSSLGKRLLQEGQVLSEPKKYPHELEIIGKHYIEEPVPFPSSAIHSIRKQRKGARS